MIACDPVCARFCSLRCPCVGAAWELLGELLLAVRVWVWVSLLCRLSVRVWDRGSLVGDCLSLFGLLVLALSSGVEVRALASGIGRLSPYFRRTDW